MFGGIQAAYVAPQDVRDWIMHVPGSTWDSPETVKALETLQSWGKNGYLNDDYNAIKNDASAAEFAKGKGVFWIGGNWDSAIIGQGLGADNVKVMPFPPGESGVTAGIGVDLRAVAHLVEDQVPGRGGRLAELHHQLAQGAGADVQPAADPLRGRRQGALRPSRIWARSHRPGRRSRVTTG